MADDQMKDDIRFLISFAPARTTDEVAEGLQSMFYVTGSYEGDVALAQRVEDIVSRYGIDFDEIDEEEDFEGEM